MLSEDEQTAHPGYPFVPTGDTRPKPRIHRNDGGWCCCTSGWMTPLYVGVVAKWGGTPTVAYDNWSRAYKTRLAEIR